MKIPLTVPVTGEREEQMVGEVIRSGWWTQGPKVTEFEQKLSEFIGSSHAIVVANCTMALHLALLLYKIAPGDEVIIPSYTWIATANVVRMVGAVPVFADIDLATYNVTAETIAKVISYRTRLIMPVHQFGMPCDLDAICQVAAGRDIPVLEDAACALGSEYKGKKIGNTGTPACFSFHPRKLISTGEGGALVTDREDFAAQMQVLRNHGASVSDLHKHRAGAVEALLAEEFHELGFNYRMSNLQGALGVAQMERLPEILAARRDRAARYTRLLQNVPHVVVPAQPEYATPNWQSYVIRIDQNGPVSRNRVAQLLLDAEIAVRPAYMACHIQPYYRQLYPQLELPNTEKALATVLILPLYPQMTDDQQDYVVEKLRLAVQQPA